MKTLIAIVALTAVVISTSSLTLTGSAFAQASRTNPASGGSNSPYDSGGAPKPSSSTTNPSR